MVISSRREEPVEITFHNVFEAGHTQGRKMAYKGYCLTSGILFSLVALAHLLRIMYGLAINVDDVAVPMLASWIGLIVPTALAFWAFRISRASPAAP